MSRHGDYEAVRKDIAAQLQKPGYDDGSAGPVFVRLAWYVVVSSRSANDEIPTVGMP
jgi:peroxiredoxin